MRLGAHRPIVATLLGLGAVCVAAFACDEQGERTSRASAALAESHDGGLPSSTDAALRSDCYGCHVADYQAAHGPDRRHQVPTTCDVCHRETGYHPIERVHPWPLTGKHDGADCFACHDQKPPVFAGLGSACVDCHRDDYDASEYPGHDQFALTCADCHGTEAWKGAKKPQKVAHADHTHEDDAGAQHTSAHTPDADQPEPKTTKPKTTKPKRTKPKTTLPAPPASAPRDGTTPADSAAPSAPVAETPVPKREHPEASFPLTRGNHVDIACADCHTGPGKDSKANTSCVGCHKRARYDGKHGDVADYPLGDAPAYFCVECHTQGTRRARR